MKREIVLRNADNSALTDKQLKAFAPAIFSREAHEDVSDRYGFVPTFEVLKGMRAAGLVPTEVRNYLRRNPDNMQFTKHMIRFQPEGPLAKVKVLGDLVPQVVGINAHDRSSYYRLLGGIMRLVCLNGLLVSAGEFVEPLIVRHTKNAVDEIVARSLHVIDQSSKVFDHVKVMQRVHLTQRQQVQFAQKAIAIRPAHEGAYDPKLLLNARREEDKGDNVWLVYNRVQENMMRGGIPGLTADSRRTRTAPINAIGADVNINAHLWSLAMEAIGKASASSKRAMQREKVAA